MHASPWAVLICFQGWSDELHNADTMIQPTPVVAARSEVRLQFTSAERRRPINWRELLGIVQIVKWLGPDPPRYSNARPALY